MGEEVLQLPIEVDLNDEGFDKSLEILNLTDKELVNLANTIKTPEEAYRSLGKTVINTMREIEGFQKMRGIGLLAGKDVSDMDRLIAQKQSSISEARSAMELIQKYNPNLNIKKLDNELGLSNGEDKSIKSLVKSINEVAGLLSPELLNMMGTTITTILTATTAITAITAVIKLLMEFMKEQTAWDKMNAQIKAYGGTNEDALRMANALGEENNKEFAGTYAMLLTTTGGNVSYADKLASLAKEYSQLPGTGSTTDVMKEFISSFKTGSMSNIVDMIPGLSAFTREQMQYGLNEQYKYSYSSPEMLINKLDGTFRQYTDATMKNNYTLELLTKEMRDITNIDETANVLKNKIMSPMTTSKISGGSLQGVLAGTEQQSNTFGSTSINKSVPVNVVNSIMLSQETIDILTDLREHQFITQINLQHTTPIVNQNNTFNNGTLSVDDLAKLNNVLAEKVVSDDDSGSVLYNDGGIM